MLLQMHDIDKKICEIIYERTINWYSKINQPISTKPDNNKGKRWFYKIKFCVDFFESINYDTKVKDFFDTYNNSTHSNHVNKFIESLDYFKLNLKELEDRKNNDLFLPLPKPKSKTTTLYNEIKEGNKVLEENYNKLDFLFMVIINFNLDDIDRITKIFNKKNYMKNEYIVIFKRLYETFFNGDKPANEEEDLKYEFLMASNTFVCPYCGITDVSAFKITKDTGKTAKIAGKTTTQIDHIKDKNSYPFLAVTPYNLVASCSFCNLQKGNEEFAYSPYSKDFDFNSIKFYIDENNIINIIEADKAHKKQLETLFIKDRYNSDYSTVKYDLIRYKDDLTKYPKSLKNLLKDFFDEDSSERKYAYDYDYDVWLARLLKDGLLDLRQIKNKRLGKAKMDLALLALGDKRFEELRKLVF